MKFSEAMKSNEHCKSLKEKYMLKRRERKCSLAQDKANKLREFAIGSDNKFKKKPTAYEFREPLKAFFSAVDSFEETHSKSVDI